VLKDLTACKLEMPLYFSHPTNPAIALMVVMIIHWR